MLDFSTVATRVDDSKHMSHRSSLIGLNKFLVKILMPFSYGVITRLPFLYSVVLMRDIYKIDWMMCGIYIGLYQACRAGNNLLAFFYPNFSHIFGKITGLLGYAILLSFNVKENKVFFLVGTIVIGFSETLVCIQFYLKEHINEVTALKVNMDVQYFSVMVGACFCFGIGGLCVDSFGIKGAAMIGIFFSVLELFAVVTYHRLDKILGKIWSFNKRKKSAANLEEASKMKHPNKIRLRNHIDCNNSRATIRDESDLTKCLSLFQASGIQANYINYIICFSIGIESLASGYNLVITPVYTHDVFGRNLQDIGFLLACGPFLGLLISFVMIFVTPVRRFLRRVLPFPYNIYIALICIIAGVLLAAVSTLSLHISGVIVFMAFNDIAMLLLNSILGAITSDKAFLTLGPLAHIFRQFAFVLTAMTGPILYSKCAQLPYILAATTISTWLAFLVLVFETHRKWNHSSLKDLQGNSGSKMCFLESEILFRMQETDKEANDNDTDCASDEETKKCDIEVEETTTHGILIE